MAVLTASTAQNEDHLARLDWFSFESIRNQLEVLFDKYTFGAVKIGIVDSLNTLNLILDCCSLILRESGSFGTPILRSTSGFVFLKDLDRPSTQ